MMQIGPEEVGLLEKALQVGGLPVVMALLLWRVFDVLTKQQQASTAQLFELVREVQGEVAEIRGDVKVIFDRINRRRTDEEA